MPVVAEILDSAGDLGGDRGEGIGGGEFPRVEAEERVDDVDHEDDGEQQVEVGPQRRSHEKIAEDESVDEHCEVEENVENCLHVHVQSE